MANKKKLLIAGQKCAKALRKLAAINKFFLMMCWSFTEVRQQAE